MTGWLFFAVVAFAVQVPLFLWRSKPTSPGKCGACGYRVADLPSLTCPECGHDVRYYGIRPSTLTMRNARQALLISWSCMCLLLLLTWGYTGSVLSANDRFIRVTGTWTHDSGLLPAIEFEAETDERFEPGRVLLRVVGTDGATRSMEIQAYDAGTVDGPLGVIDAALALSKLSPTERADRMMVQVESIRRSVEELLLASGYNPINDAAIEDAMKQLALFVSRARDSTHQLDGATVLWRAKVTIASAEGTIRRSLEDGVFDTDPVVVARMAARCGSVIALWAVGWWGFGKVLWRHEQRVRSGEIPAGVS